MDNKITFDVDAEHSNMPIRKYLKEVRGLSRRFIKSTGRSDRIKANGKVVWLNYEVKSGDRIEIFVDKEESQNIEPEKMDLAIVYEDLDIIVVNKKPGIVVHPTRRHPIGTLSNGLIYHFRENGEKCIVRLVNRLDRDTSGLIIGAKNQFAHMALSFAMQEKKIEKSYLTVVHGNLDNKKGTIDLPIGRPTEDSIKRVVMEDGARSITHYEVIESFNSGDLVKVNLETGRTHQIRVHLTHLGHPLYGDSLYGCEELEYIERQALHAYALSFPHPKTGEILELKCDIPEDIKNLINKLKVL
jgi:23S rRNA pseudouridine1911/1915/1917 synthase